MSAPSTILILGIAALVLPPPAAHAAGADHCRILTQALKEDFRREGMAEFLRWQDEVQVARTIATGVNRYLGKLTPERRALIGEYLKGYYRSFAGIRDRLQETAVELRQEGAYALVRCQAGGWEPAPLEPGQDFHRCEKVESSPAPDDGFRALLPFVSFASAKQAGYTVTLRKPPLIDRDIRVVFDERIDERVHGPSKDQANLRVCDAELIGRNGDGTEASPVSLCYSMNLADLASVREITLEDVLRQNQRKLAVPGDEASYVAANLSCPDVPSTEPRSSGSVAHPSVSDRKKVERTGLEEGVDAGARRDAAAAKSL